MTIVKLLSGEKVNFLEVNVLKEINSTQFIVGDRTGLALLTIDVSATKFVEVGKGLKMVKPTHVEEKVIAAHPKFSPMKAKAIQMDVNYEDIDTFEAMNIKIAAPQQKGLNFKQVEADYGETAVIDQVLAYVTSASKKIDGKYGPYQICNLVDYEGSQISINLYKSHLNKLEVNKVFKLEKIKKTTIQTDTKLRMATTNFTKIVEATPSEVELFSDVKIADKKLEGICIMFNNLSCYTTCTRHLSKLNEHGSCNQCGQSEKDEGRADFRCSLIVQGSDEETMTEITIFKRHLKISLSETADETQIIETLENAVVGKMCQIHYNEVSDEKNVAIKVVII